MIARLATEDAELVMDPQRLRAGPVDHRGSADIFHDVVVADRRQHVGA